MFERFTAESRRAVVLAKEEAVRLNHAYIDTEHILLGLACEGQGAAANALAALGVTVDDIREQVVALAGVGQQASPEPIPFSPGAKLVLELALRAALELKHNYLGTEHLLLGLIREGDGIAIRALTELGVDLDNLRQLLSGPLEHESVDRIKEESRRAFLLAREEAIRFNHARVGTEHILLGLVREGQGVAANALASLGLTVESIRGQVVALVGVGKEATPDDTPLSPRAKRVLELASQVSLELNHSYIGTEHLLLGLIREGDGVAIHALTHMDIDPDNVRQLVLSMISGPPGPEAATT